MPSSSFPPLIEGGQGRDSREFFRAFREIRLTIRRALRALGV